MGRLRRDPAPSPIIGAINRIYVTVTWRIPQTRRAIALRVYCTSTHFRFGFCFVFFALTLFLFGVTRHRFRKPDPVFGFYFSCRVRLFLHRFHEVLLYKYNMSSSAIQQEVVLWYNMA